MKTKILISLFLLSACVSFAQWQAVPGTAYPALEAILNAKPAFVAGASLPATCTQFKDGYLVTGTGKWYVCIATNTWAEVLQAGQTYANPSFISSLDWSKLLSVPSFYNRIQAGGSNIAQRATLNLIQGTNVTLTCVDNSGAGRTDCTINASGGGGGGGGTGDKAAYSTVAFSSTPAFTCASATAGTVQGFSILLTGDVSSSTLASCTASGPRLAFKICQDGTGGRAFAWPSGFTAMPAISPFPGACTNVEALWDGTSATLLGGSVDLGPGYTPCMARPSGNPASGSMYDYCNSTTGLPEYKNASGTYAQPVVGIANPSDNKSVGWIGVDGVQHRISARRVCDIPVGDTSAASALTNAQLGPQTRVCLIPQGATIIELQVNADAGTPNVIVGLNHAGVVSNIVSSALATAASGGIACSNAAGTTSINGTTTCSATLQNTTVAAGDFFGLVSGTAGGTAKWFVVHVVYDLQ